MREEHHAYRSTAPVLMIEELGGRKLGNCYYATRYRITSRGVKLTREQLHKLADAGVLGVGQEFYVRSTCDGMEEPCRRESAPCTVDEEGGHCDQPQHQGYVHTYYSYECERRVDSSG